MRYRNRLLIVVSLLGLLIGSSPASASDGQLSGSTEDLIGSLVEDLQIDAEDGSVNAETYVDRLSALADAVAFEETQVKICSAHGIWSETCLVVGEENFVIALTWHCSIGSCWPADNLSDGYVGFCDLGHPDGFGPCDNIKINQP